MYGSQTDPHKLMGWMYLHKVEARWRKCLKHSNLTIMHTMSCPESSVVGNVNETCSQPFGPEIAKQEQLGSMIEPDTWRFNILLLLSVCVASCSFCNDLRPTSRRAHICVKSLTSHPSKPQALVWAAHWGSRHHRMARRRCSWKGKRSSLASCCIQLMEAMNNHLQAMWSNFAPLRSILFNRVSGLSKHKTWVAFVQWLQIVRGYAWIDSNMINWSYVHIQYVFVCRWVHI